MIEQPTVMTREKWVDDVKVIACILVVLGHFFQSMTKANILPEDDLYKWFNTTIYYFHVPLFFICSGYLYQKYSKVNDFTSWKKNVTKKALALGVPYVTFTTATWLLKTVFSGSVNDQVGGLGGYVITLSYRTVLVFVCTVLYLPCYPNIRQCKDGCCRIVCCICSKTPHFSGWGRDICRVDSSHKRDMVCAGNEYLCI